VTGEELDRGLRNLVRELDEESRHFFPTRLEQSGAEPPDEPTPEPDPSRMYLPSLSYRYPNGLSPEDMLREYGRVVRELRESDAYQEEGVQQDPCEDPHGPTPRKKKGRFAAIVLPKEK